MQPHRAYLLGNKLNGIGRQAIFHSPCESSWNLFVRKEYMRKKSNINFNVPHTYEMMIVLFND